MYIQISHILPLILLSANSLVAQITGNVNVKDAKALPITSEHKALLCGKKWTCLKMIEFLRGSTVELEKGGKKVEFGCNGEFRDFIGKKGEWKIVNNQFVQISIVPRSVDSKHLLRGPYSVYKISDSSLVLGQILTSSGDWTREYTFTSSESSIHSYPPPLVYRPRYDSLREGKRIIYDEKGKVSAIENYKVTNFKLSPEALRSNRFNLLSDHYNPVDSTWLESTPTGEWISYFPDGLTHTTSYYHDGHRTGKWKRFFFDGRIVETTTYTDYGSLQFRDQYEYRDKKLLPLLKRQFYNNYNYHGPVFVIGDKDSVQFDRVSFHEMTTAGSYVDEKIWIKNLSKREIQITILSNPILDIRSSQLDLRPYDSFDVNLRLRIPVGASKEKIQIKSAEWTFGIEINSFGYHLTISDFESPGRKQLTAKFYFHRTSDEYQMEIVDLSRPKKTKFIPVSKRINRIELNKGQYQLSLVGPFGKKTIEAEVK